MKRISARTFVNCLRKKVSNKELSGTFVIKVLDIEKIEYSIIQCHKTMIKHHVAIRIFDYHLDKNNVLIMVIPFGTMGPDSRVVVVMPNIKEESLMDLCIKYYNLRAFL